MNTAPQLRYAMVFIALCAISPWASAEPDAEAHPAWLPSAIGLHIGSAHSNSGSKAPGSLGWNNRNLGAFAAWHVGSSTVFGHQLQHSLIAGGFKNSLFEQSLYAGFDTTSEPIHTRAGRFNFALSTALLTGYDRAVRPFIGGATIPDGYRVKVRCTDALGCQRWLTKPTILPAITPGIDWQPALKHSPTLRLSYLHDAGVGSKALHLSARWSL